MAKTKLSTMFGSAPIAIPKPDNTWPIPDQFLGIEIEIENHSNTEVNRLTRMEDNLWLAKADGSLRNGIELVFSQPLMGAQITQALDQFFSTVKTYDVSPRMSIHVHMNMRQDNDTIEALRNLVILYFMYEDAFFAVSDDSRKWCTYCCPFEDNPPDPLVAIFRGDSNKEIMGAMVRTNTNANRYYGLNIYALQRFGTIEFRHFPCVHDRARLEDWLHLLMELKRAALIMADEGVTPYDLFVKPADLVQMEKYMPRFGEALRRTTSDDVALRRLGLTAVYRAGTVPPDKGAIGKNNKLWSKYAAKRPAVADAPPVFATLEEAVLAHSAARHRVIEADNGGDGPRYRRAMRDYERLGQIVDRMRQAERDRRAAERDEDGPVTDTIELRNPFDVGVQAAVAQRIRVGAARRR